MRRLFHFLFVFSAVCLMAACSGEKEAAPGGVVSLSPALTELICHLGREARLIARSTACDWPESVKALPTAGDCDAFQTLVLARFGARHAFHHAVRHDHARHLVLHELGVAEAGERPAKLLPLKLIFTSNAILLFLTGSPSRPMLF